MYKRDDCSGAGPKGIKQILAVRRFAAGIFGMEFAGLPVDLFGAFTRLAGKCALHFGYRRIIVQKVAVKQVFVFKMVDHNLPVAAAVGITKEVCIIMADNS
jgi:hypothetical protein